MAKVCPWRRMTAEVLRSDDQPTRTSCPGVIFCICARHSGAWGRMSRKRFDFARTTMMEIMRSERFCWYSILLSSQEEVETHALGERQRLPILLSRKPRHGGALMPGKLSLSFRGKRSSSKILTSIGQRAAISRTRERRSLPLESPLENRPGNRRESRHLPGNRAKPGMGLACREKRDTPQPPKGLRIFDDYVQRCVGCKIHAAIPRKQDAMSCHIKMPWLYIK
jgi:hypothetical protein